MSASICSCRRSRSHCGAALSRAADVPEGAELPQALKDHLQEQQTRVAELLSLLERLDEDADQMYTRIAVREAKALEMALDSMTLSKVLRGEQEAAS